VSLAVIDEVFEGNVYIILASFDWLSQHWIKEKRVTFVSNELVFSSVSKVNSTDALLVLELSISTQSVDKRINSRLR
jgi:hypothetical protein